MSSMLSVRGRITVLATMLLLFSLAIAGTAWQALARTSDQFAESVRAGNYLGYIIVAVREFSGADRRIINYIQTGRQDDEQRYAKRLADTEAAFAKALVLVQDDPVRRQAMLNLQQDIHDYFAASESLIRERRSLGQRASAIRDGLVALGATSASGSALDTYVGALQREAQASLLAVLDPSDAREQSFARFMDAAGPATSARLWSSFNSRSPATDEADAANARTVGAVPPKPAGAVALATASNSAAAADTNLLLISKKAEEVARMLPAGNPAAQGVTEILLVTAIVLIGGLLLTGFTTRRVGGSLQAIAWATTGLARGDHAVEIPQQMGSDEIAEIARALRSLKQSADRRAAVTTAITLVAGGDPAVEIPELHSADETGAIARAAQALKRSAGLKELAGRLHGLVADTRAATAKVAEGCQAESDAAAAMAAALAETERAIQGIGSSLVNARQTASSLADLGVQGTVAVDRLAAAVDTMVRSSAGISELSQEIAAIASRTQFICLNASIEASRSGDQGKGFGVVAQEVARLAEKAHQHSRQLATLVEEGNTALADGKSTAVRVSGMIRDVGGGAQQTMQIIDASAAAVDAQQASLGRIGSTFSNWLASAAQCAAATREIEAMLDRMVPSAAGGRMGGDHRSRATATTVNA